jgi:uncharacterized radical SAM superfamily Fe-S cluster-containing enzyme
MNTVNQIENLLLEFAQKIYEETSVISVTDRTRNIVNAVSFYHLQRARTILKSICILFKGKQFPDVPVLVRTLLEIYIRISWILMDNSNEKAQRYTDMDEVLKIRAVLKTKANVEEFLKTAEEGFKKQFDKAVKTAQKYKVNILDNKKWNSTSINKMATDLGYTYEYDVLYDYLSERCHIGPVSSFDYYNIGNYGIAIRPEGNKTLLLFSPPFLRSCPFPGLN